MGVAYNIYSKKIARIIMKCMTSSGKKIANKKTIHYSSTSKRISQDIFVESIRSSGHEGSFTTDTYGRIQTYPFYQLYLLKRPRSLLSDIPVRPLASKKQSVSGVLRKKSKKLKSRGEWRPIKRYTASKTTSRNMWH